MWKIVGQQNSLQKEFEPPSLEDIVEAYDTVLWKIRNDLIKIPKQNYCEVKFEELELKPIDTLKIICENIGVKFSEDYSHNIKKLLNSIGKYSKNRYVLTKQKTEYILSKLKHHMEYYNYRNYLMDTNQKIEGLKKCSEVS